MEPGNPPSSPGIDGSPPATQRTIANVLRDIRRELEQRDSPTIGLLLQLFGLRGFAFFVFVLALLNIFIFMIPGFSLVLGLPAVILTVQRVLGLRAPLFPSFVRRCRLKKNALARGLTAGINGMEYVEPYLRPRLVFLSGPHMNRVHGLLALLLAVMMALPIPVINMVPSLGLIVLSLGMIQQDGLFIAGGYVIAGWGLWLFGSLGHMAHTLVNQ